MAVKNKTGLLSFVCTVFLIKWRNVNIVVYGNLIVKCNLKGRFFLNQLLASWKCCVTSLFDLRVDSL